jgi:hypothetical protein
MSVALDRVALDHVARPDRAGEQRPGRPRAGSRCPRRSRLWPPAVGMSRATIYRKIDEYGIVTPGG